MIRTVFASTSNVVANSTDASGTPGAATINTPRGRAAFAAGVATLVITNSLVTASSMIICTLRSSDALLTSILRVLPTAGSFTIVGIGATVGTGAVVDFLVIN